MRTSISLLVILGMVATCGSILCVAQTIEETVFQFREQAVSLTQIFGEPLDDGVCKEGWDLLDLDYEDFDGFPFLFQVDTELWAVQTRAKDGKVVNSESRRVGTAQVCTYFDTGFDPFSFELIPPLPQHPFYTEFQIGDLLLRGGGACLPTSFHIPMVGISLESCGVQILPDDQGLLGGSGSKSGLFDLLPILDPNSESRVPTQSIWTVRIYREEE